MLLELHSFTCPGKCRGEGVLKVKDERICIPCPERNKTIRIHMDYWTRLRKPRTVEEYKRRKK